LQEELWDLEAQLQAGVCILNLHSFQASSCVLMLCKGQLHCSMWLCPVERDSDSPSYIFTIGRSVLDKERQDIWLAMIHQGLLLPWMLWLCYCNPDVTFSLLIFSAVLSLAENYLSVLSSCKQLYSCKCISTK